jgi:sulfate/thiosulfate-binding protein
MKRIVVTFVAVFALVPAAVAGAAQKGTTLSLVAYSTPREAYAKLIPMFQATPQGKDVSFTQSYGASGDQARAVQAGLKADIVALSLAPDIDTLVKAGLVDSRWSRQSYRGIVTDSLVVFAVRDGNPRHIRGWDDLLKPGVQVITPNPFTSGGARWNVMAAYGAWRKLGKTKPQAQAKLLQLFQHVAVQDKSARDALNTFLAGKGDVLLTYENEAIYANKKGVHTEYVLPKQTILIENPVALTKSGLKHSEAKAFLKFLWSSKAQKLFADTGYRPVLKSVASSPKYRFKQPKSLFKINSKALGLRGWKSVQYRFFDHSSGIMVKVIGH